MDRQLASGLVVRGWLNPAYYTLGADPGVSYMAAMGGWGVLDYALELRAAAVRLAAARLRVVSQLVGLMNTGRADTNYGFWFPGKENDGAAGWQFMSTKAGSAWMGSSYPGGVTEPRGPWHYDGEIDLGFGGALRMAATIVTRDPTFGWFAYGGALTDSGDDARRSFRATASAAGSTSSFPTSRCRSPRMSPRSRSSSSATALRPRRRSRSTRRSARIAFTVENRTSTPHTTGLRLSLPVNSQVRAATGRQGRAADPDRRLGLSVAGGAQVVGPTTKIEMVRR